MVFILFLIMPLNNGIYYQTLCVPAIFQSLINTYLAYIVNMFMFKVYCIECYFQKTFRKILLFTLYYFLFSFGNISSLKLLFNSRKNKVYVCMYECVYVYMYLTMICVAIH